MKTTTILTALLFALLLIGCEKEEPIEPMVERTTDTVYVSTVTGETIEPFEFGEFMTDIFIKSDSEFDWQNVHGTGNNRIDITNTTLKLSIQSLKDYDPDNLLQIYYWFECGIEVTHYEQSTGVVTGVLKSEERTGNFIFTTGKSFEITFTDNWGTRELYLYN